MTTLNNRTIGKRCVQRYSAAARRAVIESLENRVLLTTVAGPHTVYADNLSGSDVFKFTTPNPKASILASGFSRTEGITSDANANLYVADSGAGIIRKVTPSGQVSTVASGLGHVVGLALASDGNLYASVQGTDVVDKVTLGGQVTQFLSLGDFPAGLATGPDNTIYVAMQESGKILKIGLNGSEVAYASGLGNPVDCAFGPDGLLYVSTLQGTVYRVASNGTATLWASGLPALIGIDVATDGTVFVGTFSGSAATYELIPQPSGPPTVTNLVTGTAGYFVRTADSYSTSLEQRKINVTAPANQTAIIGQSKTFTLGSFTETNATSPFTVNVNWGDGTADTKFSLTTAGTITAQNHTFTQMPTAAASITITSANGIVSNKATFDISVVPLTGTITGTVFSDTNANGTRDSGEHGLAGVTVYIDANRNGKLDTGETSVVTTSTGTFTFSKVAVGSYEVREVVPTGYKRTAPTAGFLTAVVVAGGTATGLFADAPATASISGEVFNDANGDGKLDGGEAGLGLFTVILTYAAGPLAGQTATATTNIFGDWSFTALVAGKYTVKVTTVTGLKVTTPASGVLSITLANGQLSTKNLFGEEAIA